VVGVAAVEVRGEVEQPGPVVEVGDGDVGVVFAQL